MDTKYKAGKRKERGNGRREKEQWGDKTKIKI
jgi:hypothetical protein